LKTESYTIAVIGCDDTTEITMDLSKVQLELLNTLAQKSKEISTYGCMPVIEIRKNDQQNKDS